MVLMWARRGRSADAKAASHASPSGAGEEKEGEGEGGRKGDWNSMRASDRPSHTWSSSSCRVRSWSTCCQMPASARSAALSAVMLLTRFE